MTLPSNFSAVLERAANAALIRALKTYQDPFISGAVMETTSDKLYELYPFLGEPPIPRDVSEGGPYDEQELDESQLQVVNREFKSAIGIRIRDIEDDQTGGLELRMNQLAAVAANHAARQTLAQLSSASALALDGNALFGDRGASLGDNDISHAAATGTAPTTDEFAASLNAAMAAMSGFKGANGEPFADAVGMNSFAIVAPWGMRRSCLEAIGAEEILSTGNEQLQQRSVQPYFDPRLSASGASYYLLNTSSPLKTLMLQRRLAPTVKVIGPDSEQAIKSGKVSIVTRQRFAVASPIWQTAVKVTFT